MTSRITLLQQQQKPRSKGSPFAIITEHETAEEQRLRDVMERLQEEEVRQQKTLLEEEAREEDRYRADKDKELSAEKDTIGKDLAQDAKELEKELAELERRCAKRMPDVVAQQVKTAFTLAT